MSTGEMIDWRAEQEQFMAMAYHRLFCQRSASDFHRS